MKYCPKCYCEYEEWVKECADCKVELISGELTESQRNYFKVKLSPNRHKSVMWLQVPIMAITSIFLAITIFLQVKNVIIGKGISIELILVDFPVLVIFYVAFNAFSKRADECTDFDKVNTEKDLN